MISTVDRTDSQPPEAGLTFIRDVAGVAHSIARLAHGLAADLPEAELASADRQRLRLLLHGVESAAFSLVVWARRYEERKEACA